MSDTRHSPDVLAEAAPEAVETCPACGLPLQPLGRNEIVQCTHCGHRWVSRPDPAYWHGRRWHKTPPPPNAANPWEDAT